MNIEKTKLAWRVSLPFQLHDERGSIIQSWNVQKWENLAYSSAVLYGPPPSGATCYCHQRNNLIECSFPSCSGRDKSFVSVDLSEGWAQENILIENKNTIRGLHGHSSAWLLCSCVYGKMRMGLLDPKTGETEVFEWDVKGNDTYQILVPPGIANGHSVISDVGVFSYFWSVDYRNETQTTFAYNGYGIDWGIEGEPILSERDRNNGR